jgi:hypothetical protein
VTTGGARVEGPSERPDEKISQKSCTQVARETGLSEAIGSKPKPRATCSSFGRRLLGTNAVRARSAMIPANDGSVAIIWASSPSDASIWCRNALARDRATISETGEIRRAADCDAQCGAWMIAEFPDAVKASQPVIQLADKNTQITRMPGTWRSRHWSMALPRRVSCLIGLEFRRWVKGQRACGHEQSNLLSRRRCFWGIRGRGLCWQFGQSPAVTNDEPSCLRVPRHRVRSPRR